MNSLAGISKWSSQHSPRVTHLKVGCHRLRTCAGPSSGFTLNHLTSLPTVTLSPGPARPSPAFAATTPDQARSLGLSDNTIFPAGVPVSSLVSTWQLGGTSRTGVRQSMLLSSSEHSGGFFIELRKKAQTPSAASPLPSHTTFALLSALLLHWSPSGCLYTPRSLHLRSSNLPFPQSGMFSHHYSHCQLSGLPVYLK